MTALLVAILILLAFFLVAIIDKAREYRVHNYFRVSVGEAFVCYLVAEIVGIFVFYALLNWQ